MKIYHTETQADYDALMVELEAEGYKWRGTADKPTQWNGWKLTGKETGVRLDGDLIAQGSIAEYKSSYEQTPITTYKAKVDEKMRFNKQNIERAFDKFMQGGDTFADLKERVINLVDEPEKVVVPKFVADFYEERKYYVLGDIIGKFQSSSDIRVKDWFHNQEGSHRLNIVEAHNTIAKMHLYGYTIEKEPQYIVSIMDLGIDRIILIKNKLGYSFELESENDGYWEVHFTEQQIKECDKRYWAFAVPVEGKE